MRHQRNDQLAQPMASSRHEAAGAPQMQGCKLRPKPPQQHACMDLRPGHRQARAVGMAGDLFWRARY